MTKTDIFEKYIKAVSEKATHEETSKYGYRTDFENLLKALFKEINVKRIEGMLEGEVEADESYFGARRVRGKRGRGAEG